MRKRKMYLSVEDVAEVFDISVSFAYRVVERMNADLANKNYYVILCGLCMKVTLKTILPLSGQGLHPSKKIISSRKLLPLL